MGTITVSSSNNSVDDLEDCLEKGYRTCYMYERAMKLSDAGVVKSYKCSNDQAIKLEEDVATDFSKWQNGDVKTTMHFENVKTGESIYISRRNLKQGETKKNEKQDIKKILEIINGDNIFK